MSATKQVDLAHWTCAQAKQAGASEARARVDHQHYSSVEYRERRVETLDESTTQGLSLTLYIDGKYSSHRTSDLRRDALEEFVREAVAMTRYLTEDPHRRLPEPSHYAGLKDVDLQLADAGYDKAAPEDRHTVAQEIEAAALERGGDQIISVSSGYTESRSQSALVASNGFEGAEETTAFWCGSNVTAKDEGDRRPSDFWWEGNRLREGLNSAAAIGRRGAERALARVGADKIDTGSMPIVVENRTAGRLVRFLLRAMRGSALQQKRSFLEGKAGTQIAAEHLTIKDDPLIPKGLASRRFDNEGITAKPMPVIEAGKLANFYIDTYYGRKLGMSATTGSTSNLTFQSTHTQSPEAWKQELGNALLITGFLGGNSNTTTGDFSVGVQGFQIEGGQVTRPVAGMNLASNHLEFWKKLAGLGDDPYPFSSLRTPTLVFEPMVVAGA